MAALQNVTGPAAIWQGLDPEGSLTYLGLSDRGVRIRYLEATRDCETDASGDTPADVQTFPRMAVIFFRLVVWDPGVLNDLLGTRLLGVGDYPHNVTAPPGILLGQFGGMKRIGIDMPYVKLRRIFFHCHLIDAQEINFGTERSGYQITLRAIAGIGSSPTGAGFQLYNDVGLS